MRITFSDLKDTISEEKAKAENKAKKQFKIVRSRGNECSVSVDGDSVINPFKSKAELVDFINSSISTGNADEIWIQGGFDGADSVADLNNHNYSPLVEEWAFIIWDKKKGHYSLDDIEASIENSECQ